ncbi:MAG: hypothetical protein MR004_10125 [Clostridiales bacterium]|nr:hypothetical protein [Clostridiales bacterium]MDY4036284.1 hypothetical protein [Candidatus Pseudoscilispira sp.]
MYTRKLAASKLFAIVLAAAMLLTMTVSAFASEAQLYYDSEIVISGNVDAYNQLYTVTVLGPTDITKIKFDATLYQKQLIGRKKIATMSASANSNYCYKSQSAEIQTGKTYIVEIEGQVYFDGAWHDTNGDFTAKT